MAETLIRGAYVMTMDDAIGTLPEGDVLIRGRDIAAVAPRLDAPPGAEVVDGRDRIVMPGLVDAHRHMFSGLLRGGCSDVSYVGNEGGYFEIVIRRFGGSFTPEDTYMSSRLGAVESVNGGITTLHAWDHNMISPDHARASARAMHETGLRGRFSYGPPNDTMVLDQAGVVAVRDAMFGKRLGGRWHTPDERWHIGIATRGVELDKPEIWEPEFAFARGAGLPITAHVMEGQVPPLRQRRALGPDVLAIHAVDATDDDIAYLKDSGTPVCIATPALARSGHRTSPVVRLMRAGVPLCLSVDSTAGCDTADMFAVMRITMIMERALHADAGVYSTRQVLRHATIDGARALGLGEVTGSLTPGKRADLIMIDTRALNLAPLTVPETLVASCVYPSNVEAVLVDGRWLKRDHRLVGVDAAEVVASANAALRRLEARVGQRIV
jgi:cytosine/adenosine deaminase-related metal-dependent hydrolase